MADIVFGKFLPRPNMPNGYDSFWWERANCRETPKEVFFPEKKDPAVRLAREAKRICQDCDVRAECLIEAAHFNDDWRFFSVRAGLSARERQRLKRSVAKAGGYGDPLRLKIGQDEAAS